MHIKQTNCLSKFISTGSNMNALTILLVLSATVCLAAGQEDLHSSSDTSGVEPGSKQRTIYSQKHLSPHRMMHFGKRPLIALPPAIAIPVSGLSAAQPASSYRAAQFHRIDEPYVYSFETLQGQQLQELPTDPDLDLGPESTMGANVLLGYGRLRDVHVGGNFAQSSDQTGEQQQAAATRSQIGQRLMRLIAGDLSDEDNGNANSNAQNGNNNLDNIGEQQQSSPNASSRSSSSTDSDSAISVSSRSVPMTRTNAYGSPKSYISRLLFGQPVEMQRNSLSSVQTGFNKKAEPKSNLFMHFG